MAQGSYVLTFSHTSVRIDYMQSIKLLRDGLLSMSCTIHLFNRLYMRFRSLTDDGLSLGCTCPKAVTKVRAPEYGKRVYDVPMLVRLSPVASYY